MPNAKRTKLDALIDRYYARLAEFGQQFVLHEGAVSEAFQTLLGDAARSHHWTLIPQLTDKKLGKHIRPDGTLKDIFGLVRGHWEAKDTKDDLTDEVAKKTKKGYPLGNIIFEDTREAILIQNKTVINRFDLTKPDQIAALFDAFFNYIEPQIESFEKAVDEFKERVPDIAVKLKQYVEEAHYGNNKSGTAKVQPIKKFNDAFQTFMEVCRTALNPNITEAQVDDMLVQHLLTERLIREIFDNPEFTRRNVIASEIEKVIDALTSRSFDRNVFLKSLDRFYIAIENAARTITEWSDKQGFLNTVYERFFQGYSVKLADTMGIVYTPQPIVDFMCASVVEVLEKEFGRTLGDPDVKVLDPCTGTGNFIVNLLRRVPKKDLPRFYKEQLFANEIMLLPYYIAALNIEHAYFEQTGEYEPFEGLCFVDTLDLIVGRQEQLGFVTEKNTKRVERQKRSPITIVIGNPPYNVGQAVHNESNQNRKYASIDQRIKATYAKASKATSVSKLSDAYVKFFRWATDRLHNREGIVCFVTNNGFIDQIAFDGMRKHLIRDFTEIYHLDLEGNVRHNPGLSGTAYNVFGIQVGVGITIAIRRDTSSRKPPRYFKIDKLLRNHQKLAWLSAHESRSAIDWQILEPDSKNTWLTGESDAEYVSGLSIASKEARASGRVNPHVLFRDYTLGIATHRDAVVYDFHRDPLKSRVANFVESYNGEVDRYKRSSCPEDVDKFVNYAHVAWDRDLKKDLKKLRYATFDGEKLRVATYRPFTRSFLYFDRMLNAEVYGFPSLSPTGATDGENIFLACSDIGWRASTFSALAVRGIPDLHLCATLDAHQCFPFYVYDEDGSNRRENITDWSLDQFRTQYKDKAITKWDIFHYVYGLLHHPGYRAKFADNLKRELPRIPFAPEGASGGFRAFATAGQTLAALHLNYETLEPWTLTWVETPGVPLSYVVEKMKLSRDKTTLIVNPSLTLAGIPPEVSEYRLGNRSALEWVIDQYQISTDKRSGIVSDPNRDDDPEYIVRLIGQVVRVSVETVKLVNALPTEFAPAVAAADV